MKTGGKVGREPKGLTDKGKGWFRSCFISANHLAFQCSPLPPLPRGGRGALLSFTCGSPRRRPGRLAKGRAKNGAVGVFKHFAAAEKQSTFLGTCDQFGPAETWDKF